MELVKKSIHRNHQKARVVTQLVVDDDYNVPDSKPDAIRILSEMATVEIEQKKVLTGRVLLNGKLQFRVLYGTNEEEQKVQVLQGQIPFEESILADGIEDRDEVDIRWILEDLQVGLINSRKISVKAIVTFMGEATQLKDEEICVDIAEEPQVYTKKENADFLQLLVDKKDIFRIKEELVLDHNQPNIYQILWHDLVLNRVTFKPEDGKLMIQGDIQAFVLYRAEDENHSLQWITGNFPLKGEVECPKAQELAIDDIRWQLTNQEFTVAQDFDGEERIIHCEAMMDLNIVMYLEEQIPILKDAYSTSKMLTLETEPVECEQLLLNNHVMVKLNQRMDGGEKKGNILQSCHGHGRVQIDQVRQTPEGLEIEGKGLVSVLYITAEDEIPIDSMTEKISFSQVVEVPEITEKCRVVVRPQVENLEIAMAAANQLDVKMVIGIHVVVLCKPDLDTIREIKESPLNLEQLKEMPGMVGYITREGDSLWEIAKENYTTVEAIKELNQIQSEEIRKGQKLVILKTVEQEMK